MKILNIILIACTLGAVTLNAETPRETASAAEFTNPVLVEKSLPDYPKQLRDRAIEGVVVIAGTVTEEGELRNIEIISATTPFFTIGLVEKAESWTFKPAMKDGKAVAARVSIPVRFTLEESKDKKSADYTVAQTN